MSISNGIVHVPSKYSVSETLQRLDALVTSRGLTVFAHIDFSGDAAKVGLQMRATQLLTMRQETYRALWPPRSESRLIWQPSNSSATLYGLHMRRQRPPGL